jgi:hypothetical protein
LSLGYVFDSMLVVLSVLLVVLGVSSTRLCWHLMKHHNALWVCLGSPMIGDRRFQTELLRFPRLRQYESLEDDKTKQLAVGARTAGRVFLIYVFVGSAAILAIVLAGKYWTTP